MVFSRVFVFAVFNFSYGPEGMEAHPLTSFSGGGPLPPMGLFRGSTSLTPLASFQGVKQREIGGEPFLCKQEQMRFPYLKLVQW